MIDVSQWRASIGLWNYCQAASSRSANGCHSHSFKAAVDSKSGSTTPGEKTSKLPVALSLIAFLFHSLSLLRHISIIPPTGNCYEVQCTTVTDTNYLQSVALPGGSSSNLIYNYLYLIVYLRMLLLLSGDVELNPGPMIDDQPHISLLIQWLRPLVDWKAFGFCLPEISRHDVLKIEQDCAHVQIEDKKLALYSKWLSVNPNATWRNVIDALTSIEKNTLAQHIKDEIASNALSTRPPLSPSTSNSDGDIETILFPKSDQRVQDTLDKLQAKFSHIMRKVKSTFCKKVIEKSGISIGLIIVILLSFLIPSVFCDEWTQISGGLTSITGSVNHVWGTNAQHHIYRCSQPCTGNWVRINGLLRQVDANDYEVWGVNHLNNLYKRPIDGSGSWARLPGTFYHVSASGNGYIWTIHSDYCAYKCKKPCSGSWSKVDNTCQLKQLDAGEQYLYAVNNTNHILSRPVDGSGSWRVVPGRMKHVTVGPHDIFGINPTNEVYRCKKPCLGEWEKMVFDDGDMKQVDATLNGVFAVSTGASIYQHKMPY